MEDAGLLSEANLLALTGEDALEDVRELTLRNHKLQTFDQGDTRRLINLQIMSLSHNQLSSLAGFQHLRNLVSLNMNFNGLTSLEGISHCTALQHVFVSNNRVRDPSPLAPCTNLQTLHLFRNNIASLELAVATLSQLPRLKELELGANPCSMADDYKHRLVLQLELESLDGDAVGQLDYDLANEHYAAHGGMSALGPRVDILTLEDVDASASTAAAAGSHAASDSGAGVPEPSGPSTRGGGAEPPAQNGGAHAAAAAATASGATGAAVHPATAAALEAQRPGSAAAARSAPAGPSGVPPLPLPRPGTASARRPNSASGPGPRPGSAYTGATSTVQLLSDELLNEHPLIIEYLAKHVLMEGLTLVDQQPGTPGAGGAGGAAGAGGLGGGSGRGPSFAQRLRDTAAAMNACEDVDPRTLAEQRQELIATPTVVRRGIAEEVVASSTPTDLCRQLVRLCEVMIKEVEACRVGRPPSSGSSGRPGTAGGFRPTTPGLHARAMVASASAGALTPAEVGELVQLRSEVERLCRENKILRLENENMFWLVEEVKRLRGGAKAEQGKDGK
ncbi:Centrosomal protein [Tetrabaena socialis]|uniref:Centrosomal protein n=1 Tax=Tetrabaena socialis TaxID=47790 RepID=A0A2J8AE97_9CHLO|nr:Centrosomal protein [Tetrabaena socialis]|eukprot:PNH10832.1 Centrosomal protein [Tetrabaena socialis]